MGRGFTNVMGGGRGGSYQAGRTLMGSAQPWKQADIPVEYGGTLTKAGTTPTSLSAAAKSAFTSAEESLQPGGGFDAGVKAQLERARTQHMASGMSSLVSAGLANTTAGAGLASKFAENVEAPALAGVESERARLIASLKLALAQAEQGATENIAGRSLQSAQLGAQTGLGYAQLSASEKANQGQLGLGYAQLGSQEKLTMARLQASAGEARTTNPGKVGTLSFI